MLFIADAMLGKLARWLRILGFDTTYEPILQDDALLSKARAEGRVLLTKDTALYKRALRDGIRSLLITETENAAILREMAPFLKDPSPGSRCPECNSPLIPDHTGKSNSATALNATHRWLCPSCGKLYWHGSHWKGIRRTLILAGLGDPIGNS